MDVVLNVASTMSHMHVEKHDDGRNANNAIPYCADLLGSTAQVLNWSLSTIHDLKGVFYFSIYYQIPLAQFIS